MPQVAGGLALRIVLCDAQMSPLAPGRRLGFSGGLDLGSQGPRSVPLSRSEARPRPPDGQFGAPLPASSAAPADRLRALGPPPTVRPVGRLPGAVGPPRALTRQGLAAPQRPAQTALSGPLRGPLRWAARH